MKQVFATPDGVRVEDVPAPRLEPGSVLVRVAFSCISPGTELSGVRRAEAPLWRKALDNPQAVLRAISNAREVGIAEIARRARNVDRALTPLGYSVAGTVVAVASGVTTFVPGDRVACAGAGVANHAEIVRIPTNLCVRVPDGVALDHASVVTLGAIALQGVRRGFPTLGETFVVIGLGPIGLLAVQLLRAAGCRVVVDDIDADRVEVALRAGAIAAMPRDGATEHLSRITDGVGADGVIITASSESDDIVARAFAMCRKKGRVVLVGDVGLNINRADIYEKELDFLVSTSYGPGRYDRPFEEDGLDYPIGHVRWTETRNMQEVLHQLEAGTLDVEPLITATFDLADAASAFDAFGRIPKPLTVLLRAGSEGPAPLGRTVRIRSAERSRSRPRVALVGPGQFARAVHLPNLLRSDVELRAVVSSSGELAKSVAREFGAEFATTDLDAVLNDDAVDALIVTTRHSTHAAIACRAIEAGKHVLVEKPLAASWEQLEEVRAALGRDDRPVLMTGFNRRFSPTATALRDHLSGRSSPAMLQYTMNAGYVPPSSWVHGPEGGGRNIGEACHIYDLFTFLVCHPFAKVIGNAIRPSGHYLSNDNFVATVTFADGSVTELLYSAMGSASHPKEQLTAFVEGRVLVLDDYRSLTGTDVPPLTTAPQDKGHAAELEAFLVAVRTGEPPIADWEQLQATEIALRIEDSINGLTSGG